MELKFILFFPCLWNIPKGKLMGTCYRISLLIVLHTHSCFSWIFGFFLAALCFMNILDLITVLFTQLLWFNIHTLMSRLSLSRICCKPYFSFLVHFLFFEVQFFLYIRLSNAMYPKVVFFFCLFVLVFGFCYAFFLVTQDKALWFASLTEKGSLIDRIQLLDWNNAVCFNLTFVGHFIGFDYHTIKIWQKYNDLCHAPQPITLLW